ncbi:hypothetical protein LCGC14_2711250, partial [marine sediment metagenome]
TNMSIIIPAGGMKIRKNRPITPTRIIPIQSTTNTNVNQSWQKTFHYGKKPSGSKYWNKRDDKGRFTR